MNTICEQHVEHVKEISENTSRSKSNTKRLDSLEPIIDLIHSININVEVMAKEMIHQGLNNETIIKTQIKMQEEVDEIKEKMETKDTVSRLHGRVDELEKKDGKEAEKLLKQIRWLIISMIVTAGGAFIWSSIVGL